MSKYDVKDIPDIDQLKEVMLSHIENGRDSEAWALREHWTMQYKRNSWWKPKTLKKIEVKQQHEKQLYEIMRTLQGMYEEFSSLHQLDYQGRLKKAMEEKKKTSATYGDPWLYLEFVETKLKQYGGQLQEAKNETSPSHFNGKDLIMASMNSLIHDMHLYFDVWTYEDMYTIDDENIRLKIGELARLYLSYKGIDATQPQPDPVHKLNEKSLSSLL